MSIQDLRHADIPPQYWSFLDEEDLPEHSNHSKLIRYLISVMEGLYRAHDWYISSNVGIIQEPYPGVAPDVALFKNLVLTKREQDRVSSWRIGQPRRPAPDLVFEV